MVLVVDRRCRPELSAARHERGVLFLAAGSQDQRCGGGPVARRCEGVEMDSGEQPVQKPTVELDLGAGTVATWFLTNGVAADRVDAMLTELLGPPDSLRC
ncbi:hypothetical protein A5658_03405 [Mycobacterium sp. 1245111.1]|nr:hypothetical protein A5658_03405 [Mycobacterium sp. 1245111.1]